MDQRQTPQSGTEIHALVLAGSGSSSTDAYEVGAMKALMATGCKHLGGVPLDPEIYSGSAFGAFNAAVMASQVGGDAPATLRYLERAWLDDLCSSSTSCGNGVYRLRGNPLPYFNPRCYMPNVAKPFLETLNDFVFLSSDLLARVWTFLGPGSEGSWVQRLLEIPSMTPLFDVGPLKKQLRKHVDLERLRRSNKELIVMATDWTKGMPRAFTKQEMTDQQGYEILQASATYLLAFPFVLIQGKPFGGAPGTMATPLKPVIETFSTPAQRLIVHVIFLGSPMEEVPTGKMDSALGGLGRYFSINESVNIHAKVEYSSLHVSHEDMGPVTIHQYWPSKPIINWFEFANFDRKLAEGYIAQGYNDTLHHDCETAGCTLADHSTSKSSS
jgi:predicted acylesterase/phospholipase RssA